MYDVFLGSGGADEAVAGEEAVEEELDVEGPVAGVGEDEDGGDAEVGRGGVRGGDGVGEGSGVWGVVGGVGGGEGPEVGVGGD